MVQRSAVIVLKFLTLWEQRTPRGHFALCPFDCAAGPVYTGLTGLLERTASGKISQVPPRPGAWKVLREGHHGYHYCHTAEVPGILFGPSMLCHMPAGGQSESCQRLS